MKRYFGQAIVILLGTISLIGSIAILSFQSREETKLENLNSSNVIQVALSKAFFSNKLSAFTDPQLSRKDILENNDSIVDIQDYYVQDYQAVSRPNDYRRDKNGFRLPKKTVPFFSPLKMGKMKDISKASFLNDEMVSAWNNNAITVTPMFSNARSGTLVEKEAVPLPLLDTVYISILIPDREQYKMTIIFFDIAKIVEQANVPQNTIGMIETSSLDTLETLPKEQTKANPNDGVTILPIMDKVFRVMVQSKPKDFMGLDYFTWAYVLIIGFLAIWPCYKIVRGERMKMEYLDHHNRKVELELEKRNRRLERETRRYKYLAESTNVIPWAANLTAQRFEYVGPQIEDLTGYPAVSWMTQGFWLHHIHPDDRRKVMGEDLNSLNPGEYTTLNYRIRAANGHILHIRNMVTLIQREGIDRNGKRRECRAQGFILDVTEMSMAQKALEEARQQADEANKSKSEFLANMSHELRTPLNAIIGFSEVMREEVFGPIAENYKEYADSIHTSGRHLLDLINDILDLSKIEAGRIELTEESTDVGKMLKSCQNLLMERAQSAGLTLKTAINPALPHILIDSRRVKQIILNLLSNSIKFTESGGEVTMKATIDAQNRMVISVSDTGIGMSEEEIPIAMEKFGQIDGELARKHQGTGLGLSIARSLAEVHGGSLNLTSKKGVGTTVTIYLPSSRFQYDEKSDVNLNS